MDALRKQLKQTLATVFSFYLKAHNFHWNVEGPDFCQYHGLFQQIYEDTHSSIDGLAERIRTLGTYAPGSYKRFSELSEIEDEISVPSAPEMINKLLSDNNIVIESLTKSISEATRLNMQGVINFLADRVDQHNKWSWFLRASAKKGE